MLKPLHMYATCIVNTFIVYSSLFFGMLKYIFRIYWMKKFYIKTLSTAIASTKIHLSTLNLKVEVLF